MGRTPLSKACWNGQIDVVQRLLKIPGLNLNSIDTNDRTPLHNAVWGENGGRLGKKGISCKDSPECTQALIEAGAHLECLDKEKYTPLMLAASTKGIESLKLLICYGANINHTNIYEATPLIEAARYGNTESVLTLIEYGKSLFFI
jgi:ankyrin repeat protein